MLVLNIGSMTCSRVRPILDPEDVLRFSLLPTNTSCDIQEGPPSFMGDSNMASAKFSFIFSSNSSLPLGCLATVDSAQLLYTSHKFGDWSKLPASISKGVEFFPGDEVESLPVRLYAGRALGMATGLDRAGCILRLSKSTSSDVMSMLDRLTSGLWDRSAEDWEDRTVVFCTF